MTPPKPAEPRDQNAVNALVTAVVALAAVCIALTAQSALHDVRHHPGAFLTFLAVTIALQLVIVPVYGRGTMSFSGAGLLATGFILGVGAAALTAVLIVTLHGIRRRAQLQRVLFDAGQLALAAGAGAAFYHGAGGARLSDAASLAPALGAGLLFMVVNLGLLSSAMGLSEGLPPLAVWRERFRWMVPYFLASGPLAGALVLAYNRLGIIGVLAFAVPPAFMMLAIRQYLSRTEQAVEELRSANEELKNHTELLQKRHLETIVALARSMEAKDRYTGGHTSRVAAMSIAIAKRLGFSGEELEAIEVGAILHDIGKIGIAEGILQKPGVLDESEWLLMRQHPVISDYILSSVELHPFVRQIARSSHERIDGDGYPDALAGEEIPLPARIVLVADAVDAITTDRPYRRARPLAAALSEVRAGAGSQFCPLAVEALEQAYREQPRLFGSSLHPVAAAVA